MKGVVLHSGGLDSTTLLAIAREECTHVESVTFLYGQRHLREVEAAQSGAEAMDFLESNKKKFDCLLCDIILPDANGRDIALAFKAKYPELRTVLMSGYDPDSLDVSDDGLTVISKPFTMEDLRIALEGAG